MTTRILKHTINILLGWRINQMLGYYAKSLRTYLELSPKELAKLANVSKKAVDLLEQNQPLQRDDKRKIIAELYKIKSKTFS